MMPSVEHPDVTNHVKISLINKLQYCRSFMAAFKEPLRGNYLTCEKKNMIPNIKKICFTSSFRTSSNKKHKTYLKLG